MRVLLDAATIHGDDFERLIAAAEDRGYGVWSGTIPASPEATSFVESDDIVVTGNPNVAAILALEAEVLLLHETFFYELEDVAQVTTIEPIIACMGAWQQAMQDGWGDVGAVENAQ